MLYQVAPNLYFGDQQACSANGAIVHACKSPCFTQVSHGFRNPLWIESYNHLYLNIIDSEKPLFVMGLFTKFLAFTEEHIKEGPVVIHCNQGQSRAPSLALVYMAKRLKVLTDASYVAAAREFMQNAPYYPSLGIQLWLRKNWDYIE